MLFDCQMFKIGANIITKIRDRIILQRHVLPFVKRNSSREINKENTICLFCQPRGGSTWLAEIMLHLPGSVLIDEPLWRGHTIEPFGLPKASDRKVPAIADLGFFYHQHIPESASWPQAKNVLEEILAGRVPSKGLYEEQGWQKLQNSGLHIVKFCYANMLMPWLIRQFDFRAILLTRHPCAVIASQLRRPSWRDISIGKNITVSDFPYNEPYLKALEKIGKITSRETYLAVIWALNFKHTAMLPKNNRQWLTLSYEGLVTNFEYEIKRIDRRLGLDLSGCNINRHKPSKSSDIMTKTATRHENRLSSWQRDLDKKQIRDIFHVLDIFEIDIYGAGAEPDYKRLYQNDPEI